MSKNRVLYALIVVAILSAAVVSIRQVVITKAAGSSQSDHSYEGVESLRSVGRGMPGAASLMQADHAYDGIESARTSRSISSGSGQTDRSYEAIESIRQNRMATAQQSGKCPDGECSYQLPDGRWVK